MSWFLQNWNKSFFDIFAFTNEKGLFCLKTFSRQSIEKDFESLNISLEPLKLKLFS